MVDCFLVEAVADAPGQFEPEDAATVPDHLELAVRQLEISVSVPRCAEAGWPPWQVVAAGFLHRPNPSGVSDSPLAQE